MSQNLLSYVLERQPMTAREVLGYLSQQVPGRSIGEFYVVAARINKSAELELETDDGSKFAFTCRKVN